MISAMVILFRGFCAIKVFSAAQISRLAASLASYVRCLIPTTTDLSTDKTTITIETKGGIKELDLTVEDGKVTWVKVDMEAPITKASQIPAIYDDLDEVIDQPVIVDGKEYNITCISMGNPHGVVFVDSVADIDIEKIGPKFEYHGRFPRRVNVEFAQVVDREHIIVRVWERGAGETLACGTGACASAYASYLNKKTGKKVLVHLLGGDLQIEYDEEKDTIFMTGPATTVFDGEIDLTGIDD